MLAFFVQTGLVVFSVLAVWFSQGRPAERRWACIAGLASQPFWWYATAHADQWGMFAVSLIYTLAWLRGAHFYWIRGVHG